MAGVADKLRAQLTLRTETRTNLKAENAVAVDSRQRSDEVILIDAHADAWFDGAGDNADGLAVMVALARHFAKPQNRPQRTLVFVASAGHHSPGHQRSAELRRRQSGAGEARPCSCSTSSTSRSATSRRPAASRRDGYRQAVADSGEAPIYAGVSNGSPFLDELFQQGVTRYGTNFVSERRRWRAARPAGSRR